MRNAIILAAGKGTRMKSEMNKVMHPIIDRPMLAYIVEALKEIGVNRIVVVIGYQAKSIEEAFPDLEFALQSEQLGSGHAVMQATALENEKGQTLIINGDGPCVQPETLENLFEANKDSSLTLLTSILEDGAHYGRIVRNDEGDVMAIVEAKECSEEQRKICEINAGMYCFDNQDLFEGLKELTNDNVQHEYYLTDLVSILTSKGKKVKGMVIDDQDEVMGINDCLELYDAYEWMKEHINKKWMSQGVQIVDPKRTVIGKDVKIGHDVIIEPGCTILGKSEIQDYAHLLPNTLIEDSIIKENSIIGPMTYIKKDTVIK